MPAKPQPRVVSEVCTLCGLDWKRHGEKPTSEDCVKLLLEEVRALQGQLASCPYLQPYIVPQPIPVYPRPWPLPWWQSTWGNTYSYTANSTARTPQLSTMSLSSGSNIAT
jgi:hypothetical protein